jgi:hypothetical protein
MPFFGMAASSKIDGLPSSRTGDHQCRSAHASSIVGLRNLLAERFPHTISPPATRLPTRVPVLDQATGGGLPKGAITELSSAQSSAGTASLIHTLLRCAHRDRYLLALIDGRDSFDPQPLGNICLRNLLWVRCTQAIEAVKAADLLLRDGNFTLVILDLVLNLAPELRKISQTSWYRLQRLVEPTSTAFLILTRNSMVSSAQLKLSLENSWTLADLERTDALLQCEIRVQRMQGARQTIDLPIARAG